MNDLILSFKNYEKQLNDLTFTDYYNRLSLLARVVFKWENLPNNIDEKWIEQFLYSEGKCMFFKHSELGLMVASCNDNGSLNPYNEPTDLIPVIPNHTNSTLKSYENGSECVLIRNNDDMLPTSRTIKLYAYKLAELDRTIDVNIKAQKTPILIKCTDKQRVTLTNVYRQYQNNMPVIFGTKDLELSEIGVLNTSAPVVFPELEVQKHSVWNECMSFLGINNANQDKRERLVDDEVQANDEQIQMFAHIMLKSRERACEEINRIFNTDIKVSFRSPEEVARLKEGVNDNVRKVYSTAEELDRIS